jgi:hypothetical protein
MQLEETPLVLLNVPDAEAAEETKAGVTTATAIKAEFIPLTPSNTPQYSMSRGETPSPPNAQRYTNSGAADPGGRLSPVSPRSLFPGSSSSVYKSPGREEPSSAVLVYSLESGPKKVVLCVNAFPLPVVITRTVS